MIITDTLQSESGVTIELLQIGISCVFDQTIGDYQFRANASNRSNSTSWSLSSHTSGHHILIQINRRSIVRQTNSVACKIILELRWCCQFDEGNVVWLPGLVITVVESCLVIRVNVNVSAVVFMKINIAIKMAINVSVICIYISK